MNLIFNIKKRIKQKEYKKYIDEHRDNIEKAFYEMVMCPDMQWIVWEFYHVELYERVQAHDLSKYSEEEFEPYRQYYHPIDKIEKALAKEKFDKAWEHHWKNNRHHWQARQNDECVDGKMTKEQFLDCLENVLDWMAMGYKFHDRPYQFYEKNKNKIILPQEQRDFIEKVIYEGIDKQYINKGA